MVQVQINLVVKDENSARIEVNILRREDANELEIGTAKAFESLIQHALRETAKAGIIKILRERQI